MDGGGREELEREEKDGRWEKKKRLIRYEDCKRSKWNRKGTKPMQWNKKRYEQSAGAKKTCL